MDNQPPNRRLTQIIQFFKDRAYIKLGFSKVFSWIKMIIFSQNQLSYINLFMPRIKSTGLQVNETCFFPNMIVLTFS